MSSNEGIPETLARALMTNSTENWLTAITDLGILSSQESSEGNEICPQQGLLNIQNSESSYCHQENHIVQPQTLPCLQELTTWSGGCTVTPEPSPSPSYTEGAFDFTSAVIGTPLSPQSSGVASPSPSLGSESTVDLQFIKEGLRHKIQTKRRRSGLGDLKVEVKSEVHDILTPADENRRERRRASNRRAALKCRQKKKEQMDSVLEDYKKTKDDLSQLKRQYEELQKKYDEHMSNCRR